MTSSIRNPYSPTSWVWIQSLDAAGSELATLCGLAAGASTARGAILDGGDLAVGPLQALCNHAPEGPVQAGIHFIMMRIVLALTLNLTHVVEQSLGAEAVANLACLDHPLQARLNHGQAPSFAAASSARLTDTRAS